MDVVIFGGARSPAYATAASRGHSGSNLASYMDQYWTAKVDKSSSLHRREAVRVAAPLAAKAAEARIDALGREKAFIPFYKR